MNHVLSNGVEMTIEAAKTPVDVASEALAKLQSESIDVAALEAEFLATMERRDVAAAVAASKAYESGKARFDALPKLIETAAANLAKAQFDAKATAIIAEWAPLQERVSRAVTPELIQSAIDAGVTNVVITVAFITHEDGSAPAHTVSVKPSTTRSSIPTNARANGTSVGSGGGSRYVYVGNGERLTSRELVEKLGDASKRGVANALETGTGLTHVADALAKANGFDKEPIANA